MFCSTDEFIEEYLELYLFIEVCFHRIPSVSSVWGDFLIYINVHSQCDCGVHFAGSFVSLMMGLTFGGLSGYGAYLSSKDSRNFWLIFCKCVYHLHLNFVFCVPLCMLFGDAVL